MDPILMASAFTTIVGLICNYKQEHKEHKDLDYQHFREWLGTHRHQELIEVIVRSQELPMEIDRLLKQDTEIILSKLNVINDVLATLLSRVDGLKGIAHAFHPSSELSDQALNILRQLVNSTSDRFFYTRYMGGMGLSLIKGGAIEYSDERFLQDDLDKLVNLDFLKMEYAQSGNDRFYIITRNADKYIKMIDGKISKD